MDGQGFHKFTTRAKEAIYKAHQIAIERNKTQVTPLHLLTALMSQDESGVLTTLDYLDVDTVALADEVEDSLESDLGGVISPSFQIYLTPETLKIIENSISLAEAMGDGFASTEHLLLAMLDEPGNTAHIWQRFKINRQDVLDVYKAIQKGEIKPTDIPRRNRAIAKYTRSLTKLASERKLDPVIGRDKEVERLLQILSRRKKNNPILIGEAGVGKTAIVEGLAQRIESGDVPESLIGKELVSLDIGLLVAGTKFRGEFEDRIKLLMKEVERANGQIILFIDELHTIVGAGSAGDSLDAANLLKPVLARGQMRVIGATTLNEYQKYIEKDSALTRRFQPVRVQEPTPDETIKILRGVREQYELHHGVRITDEAINSAVELSVRYITDRNLPDKAIDVIDEAASTARLKLEAKPEVLTEAHNKIRELEVENMALDKRVLSGESKLQNKIRKNIKEIADIKERVNELQTRWQTEQNLHKQIRSTKKELNKLISEAQSAEKLNNLELMARLRYGDIPKLRNVLQSQIKDLKKIQEKRNLIKEFIDKNDVAEVVARTSGIPASTITENELITLKNMSKHLHESVVGQDKAIEVVTNAIIKARTGIADPDRPLGSFIFIGSTGVGKTELAKQLAKSLFHTKDALIRVDMSEYMEKHSVSKLLGSPPGYVGYDEGGSLTESVRHQPYSVLLFDEVEKAHPDMFNILLQVLDNGELTDSKGRKVNFRNTVILMTSNLGSDHVRELNNIGFIKSSKTENELKEQQENKIKSAVRRFFKPEFLNRIDEIVIFNTLTRDDIKQIIDIEISKIKNRLSARGISLTIPASVVKRLIDMAYDTEHGAREVKRVIERSILTPLSQEILQLGVPENVKVKVSFSKTDKDKFIFNSTLPKQRRIQPKSKLTTNRKKKSSIQLQSLEHSS